MTAVSIPTALSLAFAHHQAGRFAEAGTIYRRILQVQPGHFDARHLLGLVFRRSGRSDLAVDLIRQAVALRPAVADAHYNLGNALADLGRFDEAAVCYRHTLSLRPDYPSAQDGLTFAEAQNRDWLGWLGRELDVQYSSGRWAYLRGIQETARYGVVAAYLQQAAGRLRVLDIGCGEANLFRHLDPARLDAYTGIDIAQVALDAAGLDDPRVRLVCSALERFEPQPEERFNAIVFNEVLTYTPDPYAMVQRYRAWLDTDGVMVVSYYREPSAALSRKESAFWAALDAGDGEVLDESILANVPGHLSWRIRLLR